MSMTMIPPPVPAQADPPSVEVTDAQVRAALAVWFRTPGRTSKNFRWSIDEMRGMRSVLEAHEKGRTR